jgi:hypothetical protein
VLKEDSRPVYKRAGVLSLYSFIEEDILFRGIYLRPHWRRVLPPEIAIKLALILHIACVLISRWLYSLYSDHLAGLAITVCIYNKMK